MTAGYSVRRSIIGWLCFSSLQNFYFCCYPIVYFKAWQEIARFCFKIGKQRNALVEFIGMLRMQRFGACA